VYVENLQTCLFCLQNPCNSTHTLPSLSKFAKGKGSEREWLCLRRSRANMHGPEINIKMDLKTLLNKHLGDGFHVDPGPGVHNFVIYDQDNSLELLKWSQEIEIEMGDGVIAVNRILGQWCLEDVLKEYSLPRKEDVDSQYLLDNVVMAEMMPKKVDVKVLATVVYSLSVGPAVVNLNFLEKLSHSLSHSIAKMSKLGKQNGAIFCWRVCLLDELVQNVFYRKYCYHIQMRRWINWRRGVTYLEVQQKYKEWGTAQWSFAQ
jgi:hypothetical protein